MWFSRPRIQRKARCDNHEMQNLQALGTYFFYSVFDFVFPSFTTYGSDECLIPRGQPCPAAQFKQCLDLIAFYKFVLVNLRTDCHNMLLSSCSC